MPRTPAYAELHCWSNFTFLEGASHPEELAEAAAAAGLAALALTDRDGLYGAVRFAKAAKVRKLAAICGAELTLETAAAEAIRPSRPARPAHEVPTHTPRIVLLAENARGYANLCELISLAQLRGRKRDARARLDDFDGRTDGSDRALGRRQRSDRESAARARRGGRARDRSATARPLSEPLLSRTAAPLTARRRRARAGAGSPRGNASTSATSRPTAWRTSIAPTRGCATC